MKIRLQDHILVPKHEVLSKEEAEEYVSVGDPIVNAPGFDELLGDIIVGRGFDDRVGAFVVAEALRLLSEDKPQAEVYSVATVQEEIGLRGARTSAFGIDPKIGIAVDVTFAMDTPKLKGQKELVGDIKIGGGPVIARGPNINHKLFELFVKTAEEEGIPYQIEGIPRGTGTDANVIQLTRAGVAAGLISIPNRYMHTPCEIVSKKDLENAARLIAATVRKITEDTDFTPY
jgi:endoglucanase